MTLLLTGVIAAFANGLGMAGPAHADDDGYDLTSICNAKSKYGREVAIATVQAYYGVSELTGQRIVSDC